MDATRKADLYRNLCSHVMQAGVPMDAAEELGMTEATLEKVLANDIKGLKLSLEQVVSIAEYIGIEAEVLLRSPLDSNELMVKAIDDIYTFFSQKQMNLTLTQVIESLAHYFSISTEKVCKQLFELMELGLIGVEDAKFYQIEASDG